MKFVLNKKWWVPLITFLFTYGLCSGSIDCSLGLKIVLNFLNLLQWLLHCPRSIKEWNPMAPYFGLVAAFIHIVVAISINFVVNLGPSKPQTQKCTVQTGASCGHWCSVTRLPWLYSGTLPQSRTFNFAHAAILQVTTMRNHVITSYNGRHKLS